jgi:hypothetical protein
VHGDNIGTVVPGHHHAVVAIAEAMQYAGSIADRAAACLHDNRAAELRAEQAGGFRWP